VSEATSFCSRCGFLLTVTAELVPTGGELPKDLSKAISAQRSPRSRGLRQGVFLLVFAFATFPFLAMLLVELFGLSSRPAGLMAFFLAGAGLLRMAYAGLFESKYPAALPPQAGWTTTPGLDVADTAN